MEQTQKKPKSNLNKNENFTGSSVTINATCMLMTCNMYQQCNVTSHLSKQTWECVMKQSVKMCRILAASYLGWVDNRRADKTSIDTTIRDGEGATSHIIN
jgi:hypothetical protein